MKEELETTKTDWKEKQGKTESKVTVNDIAEVVAMWTGIPVSKIAETESIKLLKMEETLHERVIGQAEAVTAISGRFDVRVQDLKIQNVQLVRLFSWANRCRENRTCTSVCRNNVR